MDCVWNHMPFDFKFSFVNLFDFDIECPWESEAFFGHSLWIASIILYRVWRCQPGLVRQGLTAYHAGSDWLPKTPTETTAVKQVCNVAFIIYNTKLYVYTISFRWTDGTVWSVCLHLFLYGSNTCGTVCHSNFWLDLNYLEVAKAAQSCSAHFTALLYSEIYVDKIKANMEESRRYAKVKGLKRKWL